MKLLVVSLFLMVFAVQDDFTFVHENQKIVLKINNGARTVVWGKKSILHLKVENIDPQKMTMSAPGIRLIKSKNPKEEITLEVIPRREVIENDTLALHIMFQDQKNDYVHHKFAIPITK